MSRKRFRPLDAIELHDLDVTQCMSVGTIENERCYCFSWPESLLTDVMIRSGYAHSCLFAAIPGSTSSSLGTPRSASSSSNVTQVLLPPVLIVNDAKDAAVLDLYDLNHLTACLEGIDEQNEGGRSSCGDLHQHISAPGSNALPDIEEDNIFSFSDNQWGELCSSGVMAATLQCLFGDRGADSSHSQVAAQHVPHDGVTNTKSYEQQVRVVRCVLELEIVDLEKRTCQELQKTAAALESMLSLPSAVPFLSSSSSSGARSMHHNMVSYMVSRKEQTDVNSDTWRYPLYIMFICWRLRSTGMYLAMRAHPITAAAYAASPTWTVAGSVGKSGDIENDNSDTCDHVQRTAALLASQKNSTSPERSQIDSCYSRVHELQCVRHRHSWGSPLLLGAYMHTIQDEYFINIHKIFPSQDGRRYVKDDDDLHMTSPRRSLRSMSDAVHGGKCDSKMAPTLQTPICSATKHGVRNDSSSLAAHDHVDAPVSETGALYSFLRWNVEKYVTLALPSRRVDYDCRAATGSERQGKVHVPRAKQTVHRPAQISVDCTHHDDNAGALALQSMLTSSDIEALIREGVLSEPLVDVTMVNLAETDVVDSVLTTGAGGDHGTNTQNSTLRSLSCADLSRDTKTWRSWLSRM